MVLQMQLTASPPDVRTHRPETPPELAEALMKAMEKDPVKRWQRAEDMLAALGTS